jgi:hypothetical protein
LIVFSNSCTERELFDSNSLLPSITGLYTEISGNISGKLTKQNSPYLVTDELIINSGDSLTIEPGVILYFEDRSRLFVKGYLKAEGTRSQRIYFTAYRNGWNGLSFSGSANGSVIKLSIIEKIKSSRDSINELSALNFTNSYCTIQNTYIRNNNATGELLSAVNSSIEIYNNLILNNTSNKSLIISSNNRMRLINNVLYNNQTKENQPTILIKNSNYNELQNNIFYRNKSREEIRAIESDSSKVINAYNFYGSSTNDPQFWNLETFRLYYTSPCIDSGNPAPEFNDYNGTRNDQGAYGGPLGNW